MRCPLCSRPRLACVVPRVCAAATLDPASTPWVWRPPSQWRGGEAPAEREEHRASAPPRGPWGPCWHSWLARFLSLSVGCALCTKPVCGGCISGVGRCAGSMSVALEARPFQARTEKAVDVASRSFPACNRLSINSSVPSSLLCTVLGPCHLGEETSRPQTQSLFLIKREGRCLLRCAPSERAPGHGDVAALASQVQWPSCPHLRGRRRSSLRAALWQNWPQHTPETSSLRPCPPVRLLATGLSHALSDPRTLSVPCAGKVPGDDCPLVWGQCSHCFHMHCILKWLNAQQVQQHCPMCRQEWKFKE
ncbi:anaphase-promoting complex subunit 11 [Pteropus vampyrus]|uniref:Anaphase-promoting complex subunit 11 n=1 Tax=Pteropus vampyrus TaxID=132908 RepID=A0A6P6D4E6_PTEVA|nr:anaphase-promoting complex subunit 11 [Pteropus vampyrus]